MSINCDYTALIIRGYLESSSFSFTKKTSKPHMYAKLDTMTSGLYAFTQSVYDTCTKKDAPDYWKNRMIVCFSNADEIVSLSFIPANLSVKSTLFVQKIPEQMATAELRFKKKLTSDDVKQIPKEGFFLPNFAEKERKEWSASSISSKSFTVLNKESFINLTKDLQKNVKTCVECFFNDPHTAMLWILYYKENTGAWVTEGWSKTT